MATIQTAAAARTNIEALELPPEQATQVITTGDCADEEERVDRYFDAGKAVVARSDVMIAIWDGDPGPRGGTSDIVMYAADQNVPVVYVHTDAGRRIGEPALDPNFTGSLVPDREHHVRAGDDRLACLR